MAMERERVAKTLAEMSKRVEGGGEGMIVEGGSEDGAGVGSKERWAAIREFITEDEAEGGWG